MTRKLLALAGVLAAVPILLPAPAYAHGTMQTPVSRAYTCYRDNPESPSLPVCRAVVATGGTQPLYDWMEVNIAAAAGRHRELIPDGKLCSAGRDKYRGLDLSRADWPATSLTAGKSYVFTFAATAPHKGAFELYLTKPGYSPAKALAWSDLRTTPIAKITDPALVNGGYQIPVMLPADATGRAIVYAIWQRSDSPEAFYSCSDVQFAGGSTPSPAPPSPSRSAVPSPSASTAEPSPTGTPCAVVQQDTSLAAASSSTPDGWRSGPIALSALAGMFLGGLMLTGARRVYAGVHRRRH
ncbi:lytic polysaccharide monooxygenase [Hamadaea sp. NPDC051192]|uniref:lytic polysaccharide monooxygenase auxiliary activity family 9 protein n=1 Tax=Hamadaea sp. NPDC051192 TaxID=3154940 RepID=UPI003424A303